MLYLDYKDDPDLHAALEIAKDNLETHFNIYYNKLLVSSDSSGTTPNNLRSPKKNFASRYSKKLGSSSAERNELCEYFRQTGEPAPFDTTDPLEWWRA